MQIGDLPTPYGIDVTTATNALAAIRSLLQGATTDYGIANKAGSTLSNVDTNALVFVRSVQVKLFMDCSFLYTRRRLTCQDGAESLVCMFNLLCVSLGRQFLRSHCHFRELDTLAKIKVLCEHKLLSSTLRDSHELNIPLTNMLTLSPKDPTACWL